MQNVWRRGQEEFKFVSKWSGVGDSLPEPVFPFPTLSDRVHSIPLTDGIK
jgi:hypothetical protein